MKRSELSQKCTQSSNTKIQYTVVNFTQQHSKGMVKELWFMIMAAFMKGYGWMIKEMHTDLRCTRMETLTRASIKQENQKVRVFLAG